MASVRQPSFSAGELDPRLYGRTDTDRYGKGARRLFNMFVPKQGSALSRAGTEYLGQASKALAVTYIPPPETGVGDKYSTSGAGVRLLPFLFSDTDTSQNAVLEFGEQGVRVWQNKVVVATVTGGVPYHWADLVKIQYVQSGDTIFLTCAGYSPATITRNADGTWTWQAISFTRQEATDVIGESEIGWIAYPQPTPDADHPAHYWDWVVTAVTRDSRGVVTESAPSWVDQVEATGSSPAAYDSLAVYATGDTVSYNGGIFQSAVDANSGHWPPDAPGTSNTYWNAVAPGALRALTGSLFLPVYEDKPVTIVFTASSLFSSPNFVGLKVYRGRGKLSGWVGDVTFDNYIANGRWQFVDQGIEPDWTKPPPLGQDPFAVANVDGSSPHEETPLACTFFEDRLTLGGTSYHGAISRGASLFLSATGDYLNFDKRLGALSQSADEALQFNLSARKREVIRSVFGADRLYVFTDGGAWVVAGSGGPLGPDSVQAQLQVPIGASYVQPLQIGDAVLWIRDKGTGVRGMAWSFEAQKFQGVDLSYAGQHLVLGHQLVDWAFQEDPWGVVWIVREDGVLLSLSRSEDDATWGWAQHQIATGSAFDDSLSLVLGQVAVRPGVVQSVCCIPEGDEDAVYLAIQGRQAEQWTPFVTYAAGDLAGDYINGHADVFSSKQDGNINHFFPLPDSENDWWKPVQNNIEASWILRMATRMETPGKQPVGLDCFKSYLGEFDVGANISLPFLSHLEGQDVMVLSDQNEVLGPFTVQNGFIAFSGLTKPANTLWAGVAFLAELETLDLAQPKTRKANVSEVGLEVKALGGKVYAGPDFSAANLKPFTGNLDGSLATSEIVRVRLSGSWVYGGRACIRYAGPLPITVLGVTREVAGGSL